MSTIISKVSSFAQEAYNYASSVIKKAEQKMDELNKSMGPGPLTPEEKRVKVKSEIRDLESALQSPFRDKRFDSKLKLLLANLYAIVSENAPKR